MRLTEKVKQLYNDSGDYEKSYLKAAAITSFAVALDALTTKSGVSESYGVVEAVKQPLWSTQELMNQWGVVPGLIKESLLTWSTAIGLTYGLDKLLDKNIGVYYLYTLSSVSVMASANNVIQHFYNMNLF